MNKDLRKVVIAGNWKMNKTRPEAKALIESDPELEGHPELKAEIDGLFALEASAVN